MGNLTNLGFFIVICCLIFLFMVLFLSIGKEVKSSYIKQNLRLRLLNLASFPEGKNKFRRLNLSFYRGSHLALLPLLRVNQVWNRNLSFDHQGKNSRAYKVNVIEKFSTNTMLESKFTEINLKDLEIGKVYIYDS